MVREFLYEFEELPLIIDLGWEAGLLNGQATIAYHDDGEWFIHGIALDGFRERDRKPVDLENKSEAYRTICDRLSSGRFADYINERVWEELAEDGISPICDFQEHSTLGV